MAYKTVRARRNIQKIFHLILHFIALAAGIVGIYAVFKYHHESGLPDVYTLHSWLGISTISLFGLQVIANNSYLFLIDIIICNNFMPKSLKLYCQWIFSFISLWFPGAKPSARDRLIPWHALFGAVIFFMAILSAETGLVERFIFLSLRRSQEALIVNFTGLLILLFAISVGFTLLLQRPY